MKHNSTIVTNILGFILILMGFGLLLAATREKEFFMLVSGVTVAGIGIILSIARHKAKK